MLTTEHHCANEKIKWRVLLEAGTDLVVLSGEAGWKGGWNPWDAGWGCYLLPERALGSILQLERQPKDITSR